LWLSVFIQNFFKIKGRIIWGQIVRGRIVRGRTVPKAQVITFGLDIREKPAQHVAHVGNYSPK